MTETPPPPTSNTTRNSNTMKNTTNTNASQASFQTAAKVAGKRAMKNSIYRVYFPICMSGDNASPRYPVKCIKHILTFLSKRCADLQVLPKNADDTTNEPICLWTNFPSDKAAAEAYLFNVRYPGQNFGHRARAVDFKAEFRVSCNSSVKWMKQQVDVQAELARHRYSVSGRADSPTVHTKPILWIIGPDPDNCSIANIKALLSEHVPDQLFIHLEKHRISCCPDHQKKVFVTHGLKVSAPVNQVWSTHEVLRKFLQDSKEEDRPTQLRGLLYAGINSKDVTKIELAALITLHNKCLHQSAAVQIVNMWKLDTEFELSEALVHRLSTKNLDPARYKPRSVRDYIRATNFQSVTIRSLMYAIMDAREDITNAPIMDDYLRGQNWNLVCQRDQISGVTTFLEWNLTALEEDLTTKTLAQLCRCRLPHDPNQYPPVEYAKQYSPDQSNHLQTVYGCALQDFMQEHGIPEEGPPGTTNPPDFTRPPRETFRPLHHSKMNTVTLSNPSWASSVYEKSFNSKEPTKNQFMSKRFTRSYANIAKPTTTTAQTLNTQQASQPKTKHTSNNTKSSNSVPTTTTTSPPSKPSTLTLPSVPITNPPTVVSPTAHSNATNNNANFNPDFVQNTEQKFLDISRELMELRTGRQSMAARVIQMERKQDSMSVKVHETSKEIKQILVKLSAPEEQIPSTNETQQTPKKTANMSRLRS